MSIPIYRHNLDYDDWEIASVYDSDDCDSLGRSAHDDETLHFTGSLDDRAAQLQGHLHGNTHRAEYLARHGSHPATTPIYPRRDACHVPGKGTSFMPPPVPIVPPPGMIFSRNDWIHSSQDAYWHSPANQIATTSGHPVDAGLELVESSPPPLLLSPCSPPPAPSPPVGRGSLATTVAQGKPSYATVVGTGAGSNVNYGSPIMLPPPRYQEAGHTISPRLAEAGCQAHAGATRSPPRRSGHDVSSPHAPAAGHASKARGSQSGEEIIVADGLYGAGGHPSHGPGDRRNLHAPSVPSKHRSGAPEHGYEGGRTRPQRRERRPSIWQRFVRRFSPSHVSAIGQT